MNKAFDEYSRFIDFKTEAWYVKDEQEDQRTLTDISAIPNASLKKNAFSLPNLHGSASNSHPAVLRLSDVSSLKYPSFQNAAFGPTECIEDRAESFESDEHAKRQDTWGGGFN